MVDNGLTGSDENPIVFHPAKVAVSQQRIDAFLRGERFYPLTMEIDLTQRCTRSCPDCPYGVSRRPGLTLSLPFIERLFEILGQHTPGVILSGGEPTSVPHFPETVALANKHGFNEIAVITNGTLLDDPKVVETLVSGVTSVRVSLYDWQNGQQQSFLDTLRRIENLRARVDKEGSPLQIAASILTKGQWTEPLTLAAKAALETGIHWLYFHPFCENWEGHNPVQAEQQGVLEALENLKNGHRHEGIIQVPYERYDQRELTFSELYGSLFLIQIGADGINYAGPECKYESDYALLDLNEYLEDDFLWHPQRLEKIRAINSQNYRPISTRHRPSVFSDYLQRSLNNGQTCQVATSETATRYRNPYIL